MSKPSIPDVIADFKAYHAKHGAWGSLHIVLDDGNFADGHVRFCVDEALRRDDIEGARLASILLTMSATQRRKIANEA